MARVLSGATDYDKLTDLCSKTYKEQAVWFLNAFWREYEEQAEKIWTFKHKFDELDLQKKADGCALDELNAHRFLEAFNETMTVRAMRDKLRSTGAIVGDRFSLVPLTHILIARFEIDWHFLVNAPQGSQEEIDKAQRMLDEVNAAFRAAEARDSEAAAALREAKAREADAAAREAELKAAQEELEAALADLKAQEDAFNNRTQELTRASETGGLVQRNKAKNELAQHLSSDPLPLRRAKITQEAAVKKAEKATQIAQEAREVASQASQRAADAKAAAEAAVEEARAKVEEAEEYLERAKASLPHGSTWWLERELFEAKKYLPKSRGGIEKSV